MGGTGIVGMGKTNVPKGVGFIGLLNQIGEDIEVISLWDLLDQSLNG
jgi:hypothetical protein